MIGTLGSLSDRSKDDGQIHAGVIMLTVVVDERALQVVLLQHRESDKRYN